MAGTEQKARPSSLSRQPSEKGGRSISGPSSSGPNLWRRVLSDSSVRAALFAFALTRLIVLFIFLLATNLSFDEPVLDLGRRVQEPRLALKGSVILENASRAMVYADGLWYVNIAFKGYERQPFEASQEHNWAFFPLYPLLLHLAAQVTGEYALTGAALSNIFLLLALVLLHKTVRAFGYDEGCADRTSFYVAAFPASYFFSLPVTESLFLFLSVGSFFAAKRGRWWLGGLLGALSSATRAAGILLFPALLLLYWQTHRGRDFWRRELLGLMLAPLGLAAFMLYLYLITGNALAFLQVQAAWGHRAGFFLRPLFDYLLNPLEVSVRWDFRLLNFAAATLALVCGLLLLKRSEWALSLYTLASVIVPLSAMMLQSNARYVATIFPVFLMLALAGKS
ncbi:MAG TPA: mannosyltransferase family protein, partial [Pyrinomonadaceae bacterium]